MLTETRSWLDGGSVARAPARTPPGVGHRGRISSPTVAESSIFYFGIANSMAPMTYGDAPTSCGHQIVANAGRVKWSARAVRWGATGLRRNQRGIQTMFIVRGGLTRVQYSDGTRGSDRVLQDFLSERDFHGSVLKLRFVLADDVSDAPPDKCEYDCDEMIRRSPSSSRVARATI